MPKQPKQAQLPEAAAVAAMERELDSANEPGHEGEPLPLRLDPMKVAPEGWVRAIACEEIRKALDKRFGTLPAEVKPAEPTHAQAVEIVVSAAAKPGSVVMLDPMWKDRLARLAEHAGETSEAYLIGLLRRQWVAAGLHSA